MAIFYKVPIKTLTWGRPEFNGIFKALTLGPSADGPRRLATYLEEQFGGRVILTNSGRSALELALRQLRVEKSGSRSTVLTPSLICRAVPDKIVAAGLTPVFYDMAADLSPSVESLSRAMRSDTAGVIFPYIYGKVAPAEQVAAMCKQADVKLIEDCAASFLLPYGSGRLSGTHGDYVIFSFQRGKTHVAGGGGALVDRTELAAQYDVGSWTSGQLRKLYRSKIAFMLEEVFTRTGYVAQRTVGLQADYFRTTMNQIREMSPLDCDLTLTQMQHWGSILAGKTRVLERYKANLAGHSHLRLPQVSNGGFAIRLFVKFSRPIVTRPAPNQWKSAIVDFIRKRGVEVHLPYFPVHRMKEFAAFPCEQLPLTDKFYESILEIPSQPSLRNDEIDYVSECLIRAAEAGLESPTPLSEPLRSQLQPSPR